jgi:hypothetical protein
MAKPMMKPISMSGTMVENIMPPKLTIMTAPALHGEGVTSCLFSRALPVTLETALRSAPEKLTGQTSDAVATLA